MRYESPAEGVGGSGYTAATETLMDVNETSADQRFIVCFRNKALEDAVLGLFLC